MDSEDIVSYRVNHVVGCHVRRQSMMRINGTHFPMILSILNKTCLKRISTLV